MHQELILNKINAVLTDTDAGYNQKIVSILDGAKRVFIAGAGRSGLVARFFAMRLVHSGYEVYLVGEIVTPSIQAGDVFIIISGSGETATLLPLLEKAKSQKASIVVLSSKAQSSMGNLADLVVVIGKAPHYEKTKGMPMGSIFELSTLIFLEALISYIIHEKNLTEEGMRAVHANLE